MAKLINLGISCFLKYKYNHGAYILLPVSDQCTINQLLVVTGITTLFTNELGNVDLGRLCFVALLIQ